MTPFLSPLVRASSIIPTGEGGDTLDTVPCTSKSHTGPMAVYMGYPTVYNIGRWAGVRMVSLGTVLTKGGLRLS